MLLDGDDGTLIDHHLFSIVATLSFVLVPEGYYVSLENGGTRGLVCSSNGFEILVNVGEGLLWVFIVPLGPVLPVKVVLVLGLSSTLEA